MVVRETTFLAKDLGDVCGESLGVVVVVSVVAGVAPGSGEDSTFLEAGGVCPPTVVCPQGNLPTLKGTILFLGATEEAGASGGVLEMAGEVLLSPGEIFLLPGVDYFVLVATARPGPWQQLERASSSSS